MIVNYIEFTQPIGTFYMCSMKARELLKIVRATPRSISEDGVQRDKKQERIKEILQYSSDPDAVFPTPIVVSIDDSSKVVFDVENKTINLPEEEGLGDVIDGQHRLWGLEYSSYIDQFQLPVVIMFDLTLEEKAYVFSVINSNQEKVSSSLIFELFDVAKTRSPQKTAHQIARVMNNSIGSPFYNRLKMLGKKATGQENATLSQGTFAKEIVSLISRQPDDDARMIKRGIKLIDDSRCSFRKYFIEGKDEIIAKIIMNCFNALRTIFPEEWGNPKDNILWKTTGFIGVMNAIPILLPEGIKRNDLSQQYFEGCFKSFKNYLETEGITLTSENFPGGGRQNQRKFTELLLESIKSKIISDRI